jgi:hypothetical protein
MGLRSAFISRLPQKGDLKKPGAGGATRHHFFPGSCDHTSHSFVLRCVSERGDALAIQPNRSEPDLGPNDYVGAVGGVDLTSLLFSASSTV